MARTFEPWFVVVVGARKNQKVTSLPSDSARYGWFLGVLAEAKLQRPGGQFTSRDQLLEAIGRFGEYVDDYLRAGLLEQAPKLCPTCRRVHGSVPVGVLVVHDWRRHQRDPGAAERAAGWRAERAGERDAYDEETPDEREPNAERTVSDTADSRARAMTPDSDSDRDTENVPRSRPSKRAGAAQVEGPLLTKAQLSAWSTFGSEWDGFKAAWLERGLRLPPSGDADQEGSQRNVLHPIVRDWPTQVAGWVSRAPKSDTAAMVVGYVIGCYREAVAEVAEPEWLGTGRGEAAEVLAAIEAAS